MSLPPPGFKVTFFRPFTDVSYVHGLVHDKNWKEVLPDGRTIKWNDKNLDHCERRRVSEGYDEDGEEIVSYYWYLEGTDKIINPGYVQGMIPIAGRTNFEGKFSCPCSDIKVNEHFDFKYQDIMLHKIFIIGYETIDNELVGKFVCETVIKNE